MHIHPVNIRHFYKALPAPVARLQRIAGQFYAGENVSIIQRVDLVLCSDYYIKKLNSIYRKKNRPTDVLSFPFGEKDFLGEIYISLQRAKIQASRYKISYNDEITRLFVHGLFHLIGYDHHTIKERDIMEKKEQQYYTLHFLN
jgi:probable rRNA maturation factor